LNEEDLTEGVYNLLGGGGGYVYKELGLGGVRVNV